MKRLRGQLVSSNTYVGFCAEEVRGLKRVQESEYIEEVVREASDGRWIGIEYL